LEQFSIDTHGLRAICSAPCRKAPFATRPNGTAVSIRRRLGHGGNVARLLSALALLLIVSPVATASELSADEIVDRMRMQAEFSRVQAVMPKKQPARRGTATVGPAQRDLIPVTERVELHDMFDPNSTRLTGSAGTQLKELCTAFQSLADLQRPFRIIGHTDAVGNFQHNEHLSEVRAVVVQNYLVDDCGIAPERVRAEGRGESDLSPDLNPRDSRQRRIEIQVSQ